MKAVTAGIHSSNLQITQGGQVGGLTLQQMPHNLGSSPLLANLGLGAKAVVAALDGLNGEL